MLEPAGETDGAYLALGPTATAGRNCGNGVTLDHGDGWQTQYCHMRRGSVAVKVADLQKDSSSMFPKIVLQNT